MANSHYGSPSHSPPPADTHARKLQRASLPDRLLELRRRANDDGHSRHRQQQNQQLLHVINMDHRFPPVRMPDGTTRVCAILCMGPRCPEAATVAYPRHRHRANTGATPYDRPENHVCWTSRRRRQSPAPHDNDDRGPTKMLSPGAPLDDDGFYRDFLENVTEDASKFGDLVKVVIPRCHHHRANTTSTPYHRLEQHDRWSDPRPRRSPAPHEDGDDEGATKVVCLTKMLSPCDRLEDDGFYWDFREDVTEDARKFGHLVKVVIPRPNHKAAPVAGVGKVFLEYVHVDDAAYCRRRLDGMCYNGKEIAAEFFPQSKFAAGDYE